MPSRRRLLALIGGGAITAATATGAAFWATRTPSRALAPWVAAGSASPDPRVRALSHAILAPNPHNLQPWLVDLREPGTVILHADPARRLPQTDPFDRQITIGLGCFLELMVLAAAADGQAVTLELLPDGDAAAPVARAHFEPGGSPDPLAAHILARRSCKEPMDLARPVPPDAMAAILAAAEGFARAGGTDDPGQVANLRRLTWDAWMIEATTPATHGESVDLMRFGRAEIEANPDGIALGGPFLEALMLAGVLTRAAQRDPESRAFATGVAIYREMLAATPAYVWLATPGDARADRVAAGRAWVRMNLAATAAGLGVHPVSQALQEYPEMAGLHGEAHARLGRPGETVQMLGRLGYGPEVPRTPRWPLESRMIDA